MLSKKQARSYFLIGTVLFSAIFLGLTYDTLQRVPQRTNEQNLSEAVKRGKKIWEDNNCMGCHTLLGEGGYYAPELTKVYQRRGAEWMKIFIKDPQAMFPGERKMVKYDFSEQEIDDVIAFLKWVGEVDTNGFPPEPKKAILENVSRKSQSSPIIALERPKKYQEICSACHSLGGKGGIVGPALDQVGEKYSKDYLYKWISDPQAIKPGTTMPKLPLTQAEKKELVEFLSLLKNNT